MRTTGGWFSQWFKHDEALTQKTIPLHHEAVFVIALPISSCILNLFFWPFCTSGVLSIFYTLNRFFSLFCTAGILSILWRIISHLNRMWNKEQRPMVAPMQNTHHCHRLLDANESSIEVFDFIIDIFYVWSTFNWYFNYLENFLNKNFARS